MILLDRDECVAAEAVLCRILTLFPTDVRLQQLMGLYHSRTGNLDAALSFLEPLYESLSDDEETAGILGGIYNGAGRTGCKNKGDWLARGAPCVRSRLGAVKIDQRLHRHQRRDDGSLARPAPLKPKKLRKRSGASCAAGPSASAQRHEPRSIIGTVSAWPRRS